MPLFPVLYERYEVGGIIIEILYDPVFYVAETTCEIGSDRKEGFRPDHLAVERLQTPCLLPIG